MTAKPFLDTNILVYAYALGDRRNETALALLASGGVISVQILNEFVDVMRRKLKSDWSRVEGALRDLAVLLETPVPITVEDHRNAVQLARNGGFRIYDGLILSAAKRAGCRILYTEDLQHGQDVDGILVRNPFRPDEPGP